MANIVMNPFTYVAILFFAIGLLMLKFWRYADDTGKAHPAVYLILGMFSVGIGLFIVMFYLFLLYLGSIWLSSI